VGTYPVTLRVPIYPIPLKPGADSAATDLLRHCGAERRGVTRPRGAWVRWGGLVPTLCVGTRPGTLCVPSRPIPLKPGADSAAT